MTVPDIPFGYMQCSCEQFPRIVYINNNMLDYLNIKMDSPEWNNFYRNNIYFMLPDNEREMFRRKLTEARASREPVFFRHHFLGSKKPDELLWVWIKCLFDENGTAFFYMLYLNPPGAAGQLPEGTASDGFGELGEAVEEYVRYRRKALGLLFFSIAEDSIHFVFATRSLCSGLSVAAERHNHLFTENIPIEEFCGLMHLSRRDFDNLLSGTSVTVSSAHTPYYDGTDRMLVYTCSHYTETGTYYALIANLLSEPEDAAEIPSNAVFVRTFGHFDVFSNGSVLRFTNEKEKELLALLVDRKGGTLTSKEAAGLLWPETPQDNSVRNKYRKLVFTLKRTLKKYGLLNMLSAGRGVLSIQPDTFVCDYYELLKGSVIYREQFHNAYMSDYSWAEETLAALWDYS